MFSPLGISYSTFLILLSGPAPSGLFVYLALYNLFIPEEISFPVAIIVFILTFGLVNYYYRFLIIKANEADPKPDITLKDHRENNNNNNDNSGATCRFFILAYIISLLIVALGSDTSRELFLPWEQISPLQIIQLGAAITISFLIPGCAIIGILDIENSLGPT